MTVNEIELRARVNAVRLTPALRLVAEYVVEHPDSVLRTSSVQLAEEAGVSQASVSRFCQAIGLSDYAGLQRWLGEVLLGGATQLDAAPANRYQALAESEQAAVAAVGERFAEPSALHAAAATLAASRPLLVFGTRIAEPFARLFAYLAARVREDVRLVASADSTAYDQLELARHDGATAAVAFVLPRVERDATQFTVAMIERRLAVVVVADPRHIDRRLDGHLLPVSISSQLVFDSHAAVAVMTTALVDAIGECDRSATQTRLDAVAPRSARAVSGR